MSIVRWNPFREMDDLFDRHNLGALMSRDMPRGLLNEGEWSPKVDIIETEKNFNLKMEIPEVSKDDVKIAVEQGVLTISGERKSEKEEEGKTFHRVERYHGMFKRSFYLPDNCDQGHVDATFKDGMLNVVIPKIENPKKKAIEVQIH